MSIIDPLCIWWSAKHFNSFQLCGIHCPYVCCSLSGMHSPNVRCLLSARHCPCVCCLLSGIHCLFVCWCLCAGCGLRFENAAALAHVQGLTCGPLKHNHSLPDMY